MTDLIVTAIQIVAVGCLAYGALLTGTTPRVLNATRERKARQAEQAAKSV